MSYMPPPDFYEDERDELRAQARAQRLREKDAPALAAIGEPVESDSTDEDDE